MIEKPLCKDCKWIGGDLEIHGFAKCDAPKAPHSLVDGVGYCLCSDLRQKTFPPAPGYRSGMTASEAITMMDFNTETCGPEGRWFEAKNTA